MRLGCLLPLVSLAMILGGGQSVYTAVRNREPANVTIDSIVAKKPDAKWLKISEGVLDTANSSYVSGITGGDAKSIYVPLVPKDTDSTETTIHVLVETKDPELLGFTNEMKNLDKQNVSEEKAAEFIVQNLSKLRVQRPVEGLVKFGIDSGGKKERKIRKLYHNLAPDTIILAEGEKPSMAVGVVMLLLGLGLGVILLLSGGKKASPAAGPPPLPS